MSFAAYRQQAKCFMVPFRTMVRSQVTTIAGFARKGGVGVETIRYYQRRGLLNTPVPSERIIALEAKIAELTRARDALARLSKECAV
jgi:hypothetical protein